MKTISTFIFIAALGINLFAQDYSLPINFEEEEELETYTQFENDGDSPDNFILVENPDNTTEANYTDYCLQFTVKKDGANWAGAWSEAYGDIEITDDNHVIQMNVYKSKISSCLLKLENGADVFQVETPNTEVDQWELISFDFSEMIGNTYTRLVIFPDYLTTGTRDEDAICYIDQIGFEGTLDLGTPLSVKRNMEADLKVFPNPAKNLITVQQKEMNKIIISNTMGQSVKVVELSGEDTETMDLSNLARGIYFITIESISGNICKKIIVE